MDVIVIQGAGMSMRGKVDLEVFGPSTLEEINETVRRYARDLGVNVEIFFSNVEGEVVDALFDAHDRGVDAGLINPAGFTTLEGLLPGAIASVSFPVIEVHASNPTSRGVVSRILPSCTGSVTGFGLYSYHLGLLAAIVSVRGE
jgi:3-dehydroquinate dehydratase-2